jgi:hypothetical protein
MSKYDRTDLNLSLVSIKAWIEDVRDRNEEAAFRICRLEEEFNDLIKIVKEILNEESISDE